MSNNSFENSLEYDDLVEPAGRDKGHSDYHNKWDRRVKHFIIAKSPPWLFFLP